MTRDEILAQALERTLPALPAAGRFRVRDLREILEQARVAVEAEHAKIAADDRLTAAAKATDRARATRAFAGIIRDIGRQLEDEINTTTDHYRQTLKMPSPVGDAGALARADARMVLDSTPATRLHEQLEALAGDDGPIGQLVRSDWSRRYLASRGSEANAAVAIWDQRQPELVAEVLGEPGRAALANTVQLTEHGGLAVGLLAQAARHAEADADGPGDANPSNVRA